MHGMNQKIPNLNNNSIAYSAPNGCRKIGIIPKFSTMEININSNKIVIMENNEPSN